MVEINSFPVPEFLSDSANNNAEAHSSGPDRAIEIIRGNQRVTRMAKATLTCPAP